MFVDMVNEDEWLTASIDCHTSIFYNYIHLVHSIYLLCLMLFKFKHDDLGHGVM